MQKQCMGNMHIDTSGGDIDLNLHRLKLSYYSGDDYINVHEFDYGTIFKDVLLCAGKEPSNYEIPRTKDEFNQSPLWADLGLIHNDNFEVWDIDKDLTIYYYMTFKQLVAYGLDKSRIVGVGFDGYDIYNQSAGYFIDMGNERVLVNEAYILPNEINSHIFRNWPALNNKHQELNGLDNLDCSTRMFYICREEKNPSLREVENVIKADYNKFLDDEWFPSTAEEVEWMVNHAMEQLIRYLNIYRRVSVNTMDSIFNKYRAEQDPDLRAMESEIRAYLSLFIDEDCEFLSDEEIEWTLKRLINRFSE